MICCNFQGVKKPSIIRNRNDLQNGFLGGWGMTVNGLPPEMNVRNFELNMQSGSEPIEGTIEWVLNQENWNLDFLGLGVSGLYITSSYNARFRLNIGNIIWRDHSTTISAEMGSLVIVTSSFRVLSS